MSRSGQSAKKIKLYKFSDQLNFLKTYFEEREIKGSIERQEEQDKKECDGQEENNNEYDGNEIQNRKDDAEEPIDILNNDSQSSIATPNTPTIRTKSKKTVMKRVPEQTASSKLLEYLINKNESTSQHPVDAFLAGVAPTLKTLSPYYLHLAKSEIFGTVQKYEMKMFMEQHSHQENYNQYCQPSNSSSPVSTPLPSPINRLQEQTAFEYQHQILPPTTAPNNTNNAMKNHFPNYHM